jgi:hypothetical protein
MVRVWGRVVGVIVVVGAFALTPAIAGAASWNANCQVPNANGPAAAAPAVITEAPQGKGKKRRVKKRKVKTKTSKASTKPVKLSLQADPQSAGRVVNLGADREPEEVTLRVNASPAVPPGYGRRLEVAAEPFITSSETGDTNSFSEPAFSHLAVSGNRKRITFKMCIDPPNDLPAGKYVSTVIVEGPPSAEPAVLTLTLNAKDGGGFVGAAILTAILAFLVLLYKGAGEKRALLIAKAQSITPEGAERDQAIKDAEKWWSRIWDCLCDLGWLVPTLAAIASAFALLYAAYDANPAWGEGGFVTDAVALVGTGLAAVGAKAVFTQTPSTQ